MELVITENQRTHKECLVIHCGNFHCGARLRPHALRDLVIKTQTQCKKSAIAQVQRPSADQTTSEAAAQTQGRDLNTQSANKQLCKGQNLPLLCQRNNKTCSF